MTEECSSTSSACSAAFRKWGSGELAVAHHVPGRGQDDRAGQGLGEGLNMREPMRQGLLVETDLGVGEVVVVEDEDIRPLGTDQLGGPVSAHHDVELNAVGALQVRIGALAGRAVGADRHPVRAQ